MGLRSFALGSVLALAVLGPSCAQPAGGVLPHFANGSPYKIARTALIQMGYRPIPQQHPEPNYYCGADDGESDLCIVYPEVQDCGGTGIRPCWFVFERKSDRKRLVVTTYGEVTSRLKVSGTEWQ